MTFIREYQYSNIAQRKIIQYNYFLSFILLGLVYSDLNFSLSYFYFYFPVNLLLVVCGFGGMAGGTLIGKLVYSRFSGSRAVFGVSQMLFLLMSLAWLLRDAALPWTGNLLLAVVYSWPVAVPAMIIIASVLFGIAGNYTGRMACGDYIDKKPGIERFIALLMLGLMLGILLGWTLHLFGVQMYYLAPIPLLIAPSLFMVNLPYNAETQYARTDEEERKQASSSGGERGTDTPRFCACMCPVLVVGVVYQPSMLSQTIKRVQK
mgnify:CR=1 FL=1